MSADTLAGRRRGEKGGYIEGEYICCLFKDDISNLSYAASNSWLIINRPNELFIETDTEGFGRDSDLR